MLHTRLLAVLLLWLCAVPALAARPTPAPTPLGTYLHGTISALQQDEAIVTLDGGDVVNASAFRGPSPLRVGQAVVVWKTGDLYAVDNPVRTPQLAALLALFLVAAAVLGRGKGVRAVIGTLASLAVLTLFVVPRLARGEPVFPTVLLGAFGILAVTIYFVHGLNRKSSAALLGTALTAVVGAGLSVWATRAMWFSGTSETAGAAASASFGVDAQALYLAGVVVGVLGALNDVTVTQAAVVQALAHANPRWALPELYRRGMAVGFDHIGSLINVLVLAYAATSLPLLLLIWADPTPLWVKLNGEGFAAEVSNILIGSVCVLLAVPLTTVIAARFFKGGRHAPAEGDHAHAH